MQLNIRGQDLSVSREWRSHIDRQLAVALDRFWSRIGQVIVLMADLNGPRGGVDERCRMSANVVPFGQLVVEATDANPWAAIDHAVQRLTRAVTHEVDRSRDKRYRNTPFQHHDRDRVSRPQDAGR